MAVQGRGGGGREDVYATLLLNDTYLPGALVLAHSLRDAATTKKLAVLVTLDTVSAEAITELKTVYHYVVPVPRIRNDNPANLQLMNRTDLHSAFTKINLWKQTQFRKIVYIDADVVAYRAPDELFAIPHPFSAAPDIGWPDLFNTGVMVLTPNMGDYYAMVAMAERGISFDGADQGLLNMHFRSNYNRISFSYNVTPSAHYQYVPAYRHFQSSINMVHFIGSDKPWFNGRYSSTGSSPFDEMTGRWWAVYDRHYRVSSPQLKPSFTSAPSQPVSELVQYLTKGEYQPTLTHYGSAASKPHYDEPYGYGHHDYHVPSQHQIQGHEPHEPIHHPRDSNDSHLHYQHHHEAHSHDPHLSESVHRPAPSHSDFVSTDAIPCLNNVEGNPAEAREEQIQSQEAPPPPTVHPAEPPQKPAPFQPSMADWDAQRQPPPADSKPEAANFPATIYEMSNSAAPFVAPERYPSPPRNMWYEVPKTAPSTAAKPIFPWEANQPKATRVFVDELPLTAQSPGQPNAQQASDESQRAQTPPIEKKDEPMTPITPTIQITPSDPWTSYTRSNAWDDMPEIERYVDSMQQKHKRSRSLKSPGVISLPGAGDGQAEQPWPRRGSKLTDFPSEVERPSLPVTPAPVRRHRTFWDGSGPGIGKGDESGLLPSATGVPGQSEWDPVAQLQKLAKQQSEALLQKLGGSERDSSDLPPRPVPFGSEELVSPTYVARTTQLLSPQPVKGSNRSVLNIVTNAESVHQRQWETRGS
ncbi:glycosyltransferase family 8 protein [Xylariaceae sp. FL0255]|nr:glycosyltransferase family 8 protein [Xylariaceae sp. FL0255]